VHCSGDGPSQWQQVKSNAATAPAAAAAAPLVKLVSV